MNFHISCDKEAVVNALFDLLKAAAEEGFILKIGKWETGDFTVSHKWLVLSNVNVSLSDKDDEELWHRLEEYFCQYGKEPVQSIQKDLITYKGKMAQLQKQLAEEHTIPIDLTWRRVDLDLTNRLCQVDCK
jgi:hypothetical protein